MATNLSKTQIDRLGERLKKGDITEDDLRLLDAYRRSFADAYDDVVGAVRKELALEPTGRPAKSTTSISEKLRRESIRLTQIQDIAGCRLIVVDIADQNQVVQSLSCLFEHTTIVDRRHNPSHGYRAVHVIVKNLDKMVEIQIRTALQQLWAELSEKISDVSDPAIKYGAGDERIQKFLTDYSYLVASIEFLEINLAVRPALLSVDAEATNDGDQTVAEAQGELSSLRQEVFQNLRNIIERLENLKGET
jgi:ppGpp synthetase/RelA/SpoT-type nucleotidyltranferase